MSAAIIVCPRSSRTVHRPLPTCRDCGAQLDPRGRNTSGLCRSCKVSNRHQDGERLRVLRNALIEAVDALEEGSVILGAAARLASPKTDAEEDFRAGVLASIVYAADVRALSDQLHALLLLAKEEARKHG